MSRKKIVEIVENAGINYGQINHPNDIVLAQQYAHQHTENLTGDFLQSANVEVAECGFGFQAMNFSVGDGRIYKDGKQYDVSFTNTQLAAANGTYPRVDLVFAAIADDVPTNTQFIQFQRLRTAAEIAADTQYPPTQFQRASERQNLAVVGIKTGTPAANPSSPSVAPNEVALCSIRVPAGGTIIEAGWLLDLRNRVNNLSVLNQKTDVLQQQMIAALNYENQPRDFTGSFGRADTLNGLLGEIAEAILVLRYRYPTVASGNGRLPITTKQENSKWVADIPIGIFVQFGDRYTSITPEGFVDAGLNARYANSSDSTFKYADIFDNQSEIQDSIADSNASSSANVVRFDVPVGTNALYINRDGQITLESAVEPSNGTKCLLSKLYAKDAATQPVIKSYYNSRNGVVIYTKTYNAADSKTTQFEWDAATPVGVGHFEYYAIRASDKVRYSFNDLSITPADFDKTITVSGIQNGDKWVIIHTILSSI